MKKRIIIYILSVFVLSSCLNERDNPNDPGAENNMMDGIAFINVRCGDTYISKHGTFYIGSANISENIDTNFIIENTGNAYLALSAMEMTRSSVFTMLSGPATPVKPGSSTVFSVRFSSTVSGDYSVTFYIYSNDPEDDIFSFTITARAQ